MDVVGEAGLAFGLKLAQVLLVKVVGHANIVIVGLRRDVDGGVVVALIVAAILGSGSTVTVFSFSFSCDAVEEVREEEEFVQSAFVVGVFFSELQLISIFDCDLS